VVDASYATVGPVEEWLEAHRYLWSPNTVRGYATSLAQWWSFLEQRSEDGRWAEAGVPSVTGFLSWLRNGRAAEHSLAVPGDVPSAETLSARLAALISFYQWQAAVHDVPVAGRLMRGRPSRAPSRGMLAHLDGRRGAAPTSLVKVRRHRRRDRPPLLLPQEVQAIIDGCASWDTAAGGWNGNLRDRLIFSVLAETGMRLGEVLGMAIGDFVMGLGGTAYIEVTPREGNANGARVKMMRPRRVHVSADLERLFADYLTHLACRAASLGLEITPTSPLLVNLDRPRQGDGAEEEGHRPAGVDAALVQALSCLGSFAGRDARVGGVPQAWPSSRADNGRSLRLGPGGRGPEGGGELESVHVAMAGRP
jgi:integrase